MVSDTPRGRIFPFRFVVQFSEPILTSRTQGGLVILQPFRSLKRIDVSFGSSCGSKTKCHNCLLMITSL